MPSVSVIIPTYNRAHYIEQSVGSVLDQDFAGTLELIVIDDGSTDDTRERLRRFGDRVLYRAIRHSGRPGVPRNEGLRLARGELVAFQDSDDVWLPGRLRVQLPAFDDPHVALAYGGAEVIDADGARTGRSVVAPGRARAGFVFRDLLRGNFISTLTVLTRRDTLVSAGAFDEGLAFEDYQLWLRIALTGKFAYVPEVVGLYRQHPGGLGSDSVAVDGVRMARVYRSLLGIDAARPHRREVLERVWSSYAAAAGASPAWSRLWLGWRAALYGTRARGFF
jgi:glycosyltransferase involved in cell wall biosynthesis